MLMLCGWKCNPVFDFACHLFRLSVLRDNVLRNDKQDTFTLRHKTYVVTLITSCNLENKHV